MKCVEVKEERLKALEGKCKEADVGLSFVLFFSQTAISKATILFFFLCSTTKNKTHYIINVVYCKLTSILLQ